MKNPRQLLWLFPIVLFIFLSIFAAIKFIFIFFFSTAFEPLVLFTLTPLSFIPGLTDIQILFITLVVLLIDTYLHLIATKRHLLLSFIPTGILLAGLILTILASPSDLTYLFHYILLGCFLLVSVIDQQCLFLQPNEQPLTPPKRQHPRPHVDTNTPPTPPTPYLPQPAPYYTAPVPVPTVDPGLIDAYKTTSDLMLKNIQALNEFLDRRLKTIESLEQRVEARKDALILQQERLIDHLIDATTTNTRIPMPPSPPPHQEPHNTQIDNNLIIGDTTDWLAIVQRGLIKQISPPLLQALGYTTYEILNTSLLDHLTAQGKEDARHHMHASLTGTTTNTYQTIFMTKDARQLPVTITIKPTIYNGSYAQFLHITRTFPTILA